MFESKHVPQCVSLLCRNFPSSSPLPPGIYNEQESSPILAAEIFAKFAAWAGCPCAEVIFVDDGSRDESAARLVGNLPRICRQMPRLSQNYAKIASCAIAKMPGQSAALVTGIRAATAEWIVTLDGDGQNDPADIEKLWHVLQKEMAQLSPPIKYGEF